VFTFVNLAFPQKAIFHGARGLGLFSFYDCSAFSTLALFFSELSALDMEELTVLLLKLCSYEQLLLEIQIAQAW
jgi:hypothetical protein